jgi:hypothetical protein
MVCVIQHHYMTPVPDILAVRPDVPKELLDIVYCSLNKDPNDRFASTRDMAVALENIQMTDSEREESDNVLRDLSAGRVIAKIRTGSLPPLAITISGPGPRVQPRPLTAPKSRGPSPAVPVRVFRRKKKNKALAPAMAMVFFGLAGGGYMAYSDSVQRAEAQRAAERAQRDSVQALEAASRGSRVIAGLPDTVVAVIDNRPFRNGDVFSDKSGAYYVRVKAAGFEELFQPFTVEAGRTDTLLLSLQRTAGTVVATRQVQQDTPRQVAVRGPVDSAEVRISVMPPHADIAVDGLRIGSGRIARKLPVGQHTLHYSAPNCDPEDRSITVSPGEPLLVPILTLQCH